MVKTPIAIYIVEWQGQHDKDEDVVTGPCYATYTDIAQARAMQRSVIGGKARLFQGHLDDFVEV